jgi:hypothetical protein
MKKNGNLQNSTGMIHASNNKPWTEINFKLPFCQYLMKLLKDIFLSECKTK